MESKNRYTTIIMKNKANRTMSTSSKVLRVDKKINMLPEVKTANIHDFLANS